MAQVHIPTLLRQYTQNKKVIIINEKTIRGILSNLVNTYPLLSFYLFNETAELSPFINLYLNNQNVRLLSQETSVAESGIITIVPAVSGG